MFRKPFQLYPLQKFSLYQPNSASNTAEEFFFFFFFVFSLVTFLSHVSQCFFQTLIILISFLLQACLIFSGWACVLLSRENRRLKSLHFNTHHIHVFTPVHPDYLRDSFTSFKTWLTCPFYFLFFHFQPPYLIKNIFFLCWLNPQDSS